MIGKLARIFRTAKEQTVDKVPRYDIYRFKPLEDITAFELALIMSRMTGPLNGAIKVKQGADIDPLVARHFQRDFLIDAYAFD